ncbi:MAG TPA: MarR family transcriptional regulator [Candidatus Limnocylindria bacterium]|nr:MarR family transcriptional regulator [Candidatus Limnocylindria bacterium]
MRGDIAPPPALSVADEIWSLLFRLSDDHFRERISPTLEGFQLSRPQAFLLYEVRSGRPLSQHDVADRLHCEPSNVTGLIDRLEAKGLVERRPDPADRRVKRLLATKKGRALITKVMDRFFKAPPSVNRLSTEEQRTLRDLLRRLADAGVERQTVAGSLHKI